MHMDPLLPRLVAALLAVVAVAFGLRRAGAPTLVAYLLAGVALGPEGLALLDDRVLLTRVGEFGVLLLLFFVGMEMSLPRLLEGWKVALIGTLLQILATVGLSLGIGALLDWPLGRSVLIGFVISLSSTAIVIRLLQERDELEGPVGQDVLGVLLAQDLAIVPMLMVLGVLAGDGFHPAALGAQAAVGGAAVAAVLAVRRRPEPLQRLIDRVGADPDLRIFGALLFCLGLSLLTSVAGLSTAAGAFLAGLLLSVADRTEWAHQALDGLRVLLLAVFFAAIGSLLQLDFLRAHWPVVGLLIAVSFGANTAINTGILRALGRPWSHALVGGAYLSQIGELSFVLAAVGLSSGLIQEFGYRLTVSVIAGTLLLSTGWISVMQARAGRLAEDAPMSDEAPAPSA